MEHVVGLFLQIDEMRVEGWEELRYPTVALHYGIDLVRWMIARYEHVEQELADRSRDRSAGKGERGEGTG